MRGERETLSTVGIGGSLRSRSGSLAALRVALDGAAESGAGTELIDVRELDLPAFAPGRGEPPEAAARLARAVSDAQGLIWSSPLYHGTVSGSFKNALDWLELLSDEEPAYLTDKTVGLISAGGGSQGLQAINTMEFVVRALRGWTVPLVVPVAQAWRAFDLDGRPRSEELELQLRMLGREVAAAALKLSAPSPRNLDTRPVRERTA
ncbi:MAG: NAD(P)H-dependent oxidoreductase [Actinobacteria bacterium]|nr:NAD(P)H-dependent oxidoreductase [Actinomycetota bacterium]MDQ3530790.1 NAD(P)H-dependent oxidoreductase [Actinomycetota bacterium]